jgi:hypothetical protein
MREIKLAPQASDQTVTPEIASDTPGNEIQLLSDLELALAGGGDIITPWP